jgi:hypothetical protein
MSPRDPTPEETWRCQRQLVATAILNCGGDLTLAMAMILGAATSIAVSFEIERLHTPAISAYPNAARNLVEIIQTGAEEPHGPGYVAECVELVAEAEKMATRLELEIHQRQLDALAGGPT